MRDWEIIQAYEHQQQLLVEGIVTSLHQETHDDENYLHVFGKLARRMLYNLTMGVDPSKDQRFIDLYEQKIRIPIGRFVDPQPSKSDRHKLVERLYLESRVLEKVLGSIQSSITGAYHRHELLAHTPNLA